MLVSFLRDHRSLPEIVSVGKTTRITVANDMVDTRIFLEGSPHPSGKLKIGEFCSIATRASFFLGGNHNTKRITTWLPSYDSYDISQELKTNGDIIIEDDVWIGMGAVIMSGATIRTGSVVGAYSVVSGSFEPYSIIAGNPGRVVRKRFDDRKIEILLKSKWWTWDLDFINQNRHIVFSEDFSLFEDLVSSLDNDKSF